ncbi:MAG: aromatic-ring-hydroxylating dioxygenase subunit beta [Hyphomonadaceae bacterium]
MSAAADPALAAQVEQFLFAEAELLDSWRLEEWVDLFTEDGAYLVPSTDLPEDASPRNSLFYIADNHHRLRERAKRLMKKTAFAEFPHSRMRRLISNVRVSAPAANEVAAVCNFSAARTAHGRTLTYVGRTKYRLAQEGGGFRIKEKRVFLDLDGLREHGRITAPL